MSQTQVDKERQGVLQAKFDANIRDASQPSLTGAETAELAELKENA